MSRQTLILPWRHETHTHVLTCTHGFKIVYSHNKERCPIISSYRPTRGCHSCLRAPVYAPRHFRRSNGVLHLSQMCLTINTHKLACWITKLDGEENLIYYVSVSRLETLEISSKIKALFFYPKHNSYSWETLTWFHLNVFSEFLITKHAVTLSRISCHEFSVSLFIHTHTHTSLSLSRREMTEDQCWPTITLSL